MLEKKSFTGGMNKDLEDRFIPSSDWKDAWNIRAISTDSNSVGAIENCKGNKFVTGIGADPQDDVLVIGTYEDKGFKRVYYFVYIKDQYNEYQHSIVQYNIEDNTSDYIAFSCPALNFQKDHLITGISVLDDLYLVWTDNYNEPGFIDLSKARANTYGQQTDAQDIRLIPYAPVDPITYNYENDTLYPKNNLRGNLWQFKYRFIYSDGRKSAFSPISRIIFPIEFMDISGINYNVNQLDQTKNNKISLSVPISKIGSISKVEIACRENNLADFKIFKTLKTENYSDEYDLPLGFSGTKIISFYNDEPQKSIAINESNTLFSFVPQKAKSLDIVNNNRLVLANFEEGFDNIEMGNSSAGVIPTTIIPGGINPSGSFINLGIYKADVPNSQNQGFRFHVLEIGSSVYANRVYSLILTPASGVPKTYQFQTSSSSTNSDITNYFISQINSDFRDNNNANGLPLFPPRCVTASTFFTIWGAFGVVEGTYMGVNISSGLPVTTNDPLGKFLVINNIGNEDENRIVSVSLSISDISDSQDYNSIQSFKTNAYHKFGIVYYDEAGRASTVQTNDRFKSYCSYKTNSVNGQVYGRMYITHPAPNWAKKYQIVYSGSLGYLNDPAEGRGFIQFLLNKDPEQYDTVSTDLKRWKISMDSAYWYSLKFNQNPISYTWKKGDRLRVIKSGSNYFSPQYRDFNILSYDSSQLDFVIETDGTSRPSEGDLLEVYTPTNNIDTDLYYETGYVFDINELGEHQGNVSNQTLVNTIQAAVIDFQAGDVFLRNRTMDKIDPQTGTNQVTHLIEDSHYSDFYASNSYNKGRPNIFSLDERKIRRNTTARYSNVYIPDTNINGIGMFFDVDFFDYDKAYGSINKIRNRGTDLIVFQVTKVGRVQVNASILTDLSNFSAVQKSDQVLSDITYYSEDTGIGDHPESFAESGNSIYFVDSYKGCVNRLSLDGINRISNYGLRSFFNKELARVASKNIWGVYDERFNNYIISFPAYGDYVGYAIAFDESINKWTSLYSYPAEASVSCGINIMTFKKGLGYIHNADGVPYCNFYGVQYPSSVQIAFNENPSNNKFFTNIEEESNAIWTCEITNQFNQRSNLIKTDFEKIENVYWASFYKDQNSPGGLIEGDDLRSPELIIKLSNDNTNFVKLFTVGVKYNFSELTNR